MQFAAALIRELKRTLQHEERGGLARCKPALLAGEAEVASFIASGVTDKQIAARLEPLANRKRGARREVREPRPAHF